jgi:hypothetical protein
VENEVEKILGIDELGKQTCGLWEMMQTSPYDVCMPFLALLTIALRSAIASREI